MSLESNLYSGLDSSSPPIEVYFNIRACNKVSEALIQAKLFYINCIGLKQGAGHVNPTPNTNRNHEKAISS